MKINQAYKKFEEFLKHEKKASSHTISNYLRDLKQLLRFAREQRPDIAKVEEIDIILLRGYLAGQYHGQCSHHSPSHSSNDVVEGCSVLFLGLNFVEILDTPVNAVIDWFTKPFDYRFPRWSSLSGNGDMRGVHYISHHVLPDCWNESPDKSSITASL